MTVTRKLIDHASKLLNLKPTDHRYIGYKQKLFFFDELSHGSCFFQPRGAHIYNKLMQYLRQEYKKRNYDEVITPNIYSCQLWKTSGHWDYYKDNMIKFDMFEREFSLKPMNCPGHCVMFQYQSTKTSDQLPVRWADFGVLHRNELSGSLMGLTRVRRFQQDDAHIFCTPQQVESEVRDCLDFANDVYSQFGFTFDVKLSLRPESYLGESSLWDKAEHSLRAALQTAQLKWEEQKFEGAFYGPKIDLIVKDSRGRSHQCATIQLDFQLPERFELAYRELNEGADEKSSLQRPVIIHRAILGSLERFIAMIAENCEGRWPFWLSPLQAQVIPVHFNLNNQAELVSEQFRRLGFWTDCDLRPSVTLNAKIREALMMPYNLILLIGQREVDTKSVTCRLLGNHSLDDVDSQTDNTSGSIKKKKHVHNINVPVVKLIEHFQEFERSRVNRADLELLELYVK